MGQILSAKCFCGYSKEFLMSGIGMSYVRRKSILALAHHLNNKEVMVVDLINDHFDPEEVRFYNDRILNYYDDMGISEKNLDYLIQLVSDDLPRNNFCPSCNSEALNFEVQGMWD
jgi:hypothetical protein